MENKKYSLLSITLYSLGGAVMLAGILLIIGQQWLLMPSFARVAVLLIPTIATGYYAILLAQKERYIFSQLLLVAFMGLLPATVSLFWFEYIGDVTLFAGVVLQLIYSAIFVTVYKKFTLPYAFLGSIAYSLSFAAVTLGWIFESFNIIPSAIVVELFVILAFSLVLYAQHVYKNHIGIVGGKFIRALLYVVSFIGIQSTLLGLDSESLRILTSIAFPFYAAYLALRVPVVSGFVVSVIMLTITILIHVAPVLQVFGTGLALILAGLLIMAIGFGATKVYANKKTTAMSDTPTHTDTPLSNG